MPVAISRQRSAVALIAALGLLAPTARAQRAAQAAAPVEAAPGSSPHVTLPRFGTVAPRDGLRLGPNLAKDPTLYVVGYAHLDTEWRWEYPQVIDEYLPKTMHDNFALFAKYPHYVFNFSGANRYRMMKEYWPLDYARLKNFVAQGRWFPAGSSMEEGDVNAPSAEAILRQILYGNEFFRTEFHVASQEYMLPDCFGFPWSLPTILAHAGVKGFSTQKLTWGSSVPDQPSTPVGMEGKGVPFNVGRWIGPDGKGVIAALNPGSYSGGVSDNLSTDTTWIARINRDGAKYGVYADYHYYGTGDTGGAPRESSVAEVEKSVTSHGPLDVVSATADQMFKDLTPSEAGGLPRYAGEMELQNHSAGSLTSQAYQKRWIRQEELLADGAEKASVAAAWLGSRAYPMDRLNDAWTLAMAAHFHDLAAGTATPRSYEFAWNDDVIGMNQFASVLTTGSQAVAAAMNTQTQGVPLVVYNALNVARQDVVEATVPFSRPPRGVTVVGPDGNAVPAQLDSWSSGQAHILFVARAPSVGYAVYDVRPSSGSAAQSALSVTARTLENADYRVTLNDAGDVASIVDKTLHKELLSAPIRLALLEDTPAQWPAWNMDFDDEQAAPSAYVGAEGRVRVRISERGAARVALTVTRTVDSSTFVQTISLSAGDAGRRVEFHNAIDWHMPATMLKATFPFTASDSVATYNWDVGTIERGNAYPRKFEVPSHQWIDLTDRSGAYGVTVLTDDKNGSDKPTDNTIRLTLLRTPGLSTQGYSYSDQASQDFGHHEFVYGLAGHAGSWRSAQTDWTGYELNDPLRVFFTTRHGGTLGRRWSLLQVNDGRVRVMALKRAEGSDEYVVRITEMSGRAQPDVRLTFAAPVTAAREVNGQEQPVGPAVVENGSLVTSLTPYAIRSFAFKLAPPAQAQAAPTSQPVALDYDRAVASNDDTHAVGGFNAAGEALPAEMLPDSIDYDGIAFHLAPAASGLRNAVTARGQRIALPAGRYDRVYLLAASDSGDRMDTFQVGRERTTLNVQAWDGFIGQWYDRSFKQVPAPPPTPEEQAAQERRLAQFRARADSTFHLRLDSTRAAGGDTLALIQAYQQQQARRGRGFRQRMLEVMDALTPGFIKRAPVAWYASHKHTPEGKNAAYAYSYLFAYQLAVPAGATTLTLPNDPHVRILAVTVADQQPVLEPAHPLYDTLKPGTR
jgi:alpha-mannosidase